MDETSLSLSQRIRLRLTRFKPSKRLIVHAAFLLLAAGIAWQSQAALGVDQTSLLYTLISGEEVAEGPLDPTAYAFNEGPGIGGDRLAVLNPEDTGLDSITLEDPEATFVNTLGGSALVAPLQPLVAEPGSEPQQKSHQTRVYTIEENDTIAAIAAKFDISENTIIWANGLRKNSTLKVGDHLTILPTTGVLHTVASGDTLLAIADEYDVDALEIKKYNGLTNSDELGVGKNLIVPDGDKTPVAAPQIVPYDTAVASNAKSIPAALENIGSGFAWPTTTKHISQYFQYGHTGIDIDNRSRPPVHAAESGVVKFAGWLGGYGKLLIIGGALETYYAHLDEFYVGKGETVAKGQAIGKMGSTGRSSGPHLHFEARKNGQPMNPLSIF